MKVLTRPQQSQQGTRTRATDTVVGLAGLAALVLAVLYAFGPAIAERSTYTWAVDRETGPPAFTPLELTNPTPERLDVTIPCPSSSTDALEFTSGTADTALHVAVRDERLRISTASSEIVNSPWPAPSAACPGGFAIDDGGGWALRDQAGAVIADGDAAHVTVSHLSVTGSAALAAELTAEVVTQPHGSRPSGRQLIFVVGALAAAGTALVLGLRRRPYRLRIALQPLLRHAGWVDVVVLGALIVWAVLGPAFYDDGWILANARHFPELGTIANDYDATSSTLPLGYWYQWLWHFPAIHIATPLYLRALMLPFVVVLWILMRACLHVVSMPRETTTRQHVTLASTFLVGAAAWLITVRTESLVALLATGVLTAAIFFRRRPSLVWLTVGFALAGLAFSAHPAGVVAFAPLILSAPAIVRWLRGREASGIRTVGSLTAVGSLVIVLLFVDSDIGLKLESAARFEEAIFHEFGWQDEPFRYRMLFGTWATPARLLSVGVGAVAVVSVLSTRNRWRRLDALPSWSLVLGLLLFWLVPSKWPWHFGTLVGFIALAVTLESAAWNRFGAGERRVRLTAMGFLLAVVIVSALAGSASWNALDLVSLTWPGERSAVPLLLLVILAAAVWAYRSSSPSVRDWRTTVVLLPATACAVVLALTVGYLAADAAATEGWTFGKQNLTALVSPGDCGAADEILVPGRGSSSTVTSLRRAIEETGDLAVMVHPDVGLYVPCLQQRSMKNGVAEVPDIIVATPPDAGDFAIPDAQEYQELSRSGFLVLLGERYLTGRPLEFGATLARTPSS